MAVGSVNIDSGTSVSINNENRKFLNLSNDNDRLKISLSCMPTTKMFNFSKYPRYGNLRVYANDNYIAYSDSFGVYLISKQEGLKKQCSLQGIGSDIPCMYIKDSYLYIMVRTSNLVVYRMAITGIDSSLTQVTTISTSVLSMTYSVNIKIFDTDASYAYAVYNVAYKINLDTFEVTQITSTYPSQTYQNRIEGYAFWWYKKNNDIRIGLPGINSLWYYSINSCTYTMSDEWGYTELVDNYESFPGFNHVRGPLLNGGTVLIKVGNDIYNCQPECGELYSYQASSDNPHIVGKGNYGVKISNDKITIPAGSINDVIELPPGIINLSMSPNDEIYALMLWGKNSLLRYGSSSSQEFNSYQFSSYIAKLELDKHVEEV